MLIKNKLFLIFFITALMLSSLQTTAQIALGAKGGANWARVDFNPRISQDPIQTYHGGFVFRYISEKNFGIITELNYTQKGWKQTYRDTSDVSAYDKRTTNYFELPFLSHIYFGKKKLRFFINLGFAFSYAESARHETMRASKKSEKEYKFDDKIDKKFEYGILGGLGFEYKIKSHSIFIESRYYYALTDLRKEEGAQEIDFARNQYFNVSLGYLFSFGEDK